MKNVLTIIASALLLIACGGQEKSVDSVISSGNIDEIRNFKSVKVSAKQQLDDEIKSLEDAISELDTVKKISLITTFMIKDSVFKHYLELQGNVNTKNLLVIYPEYSGVLTNVFVKEGQRVSKGQSLAKIDDGGLSQQLAQLEIQSDLAKTTFERQERLWNQKIGSEIQFLQAKSNYEAQQKAIGQLQRQIAKTIVRAPFSGTIDEIITEQGSVVAPGQSSLMRIINLNNMYVETEVPERYISEVVKNKSVQVEIPILGLAMNAKVRQAGNFINPVNRTFKVEIGVPNKNQKIKPNLTAKVRINDYSNDSAILIPLSIISENANGQQYVYVVTNKNGNKGIAHRSIIETGRSQGNLIEVLSGLKTGDEIIREGARSVKEGQNVLIEAKK